MTTITRDFDDIYLKPTKAGWHLTLQENVPITLRIEVTARSRSDWDIEAVYLLDQYAEVGTNLTAEATLKLEGACELQALHFINQCDSILESLQDKVDQEIIPDVTWGEQGEAGRRL